MNDRIEEIKRLLDELAAQLEGADAEDTEELSRKADELIAEKRELEKKAEDRAAKLEEVRSAIDSGAAKVVESWKPGSEVRTYDASSAEYRRAWLKDIAGGSLGKMTDEERAAFTATTANSGSVVPTITQNRIIDLVNEQTAIYADLTIQSFANVYEVARLTAISQGDAASTNEGVANDDENNAFDVITLTGKEFKKHVKLSRKMQVQSIDAFESWLVSEVATRILWVMDGYVFTQLDDAANGIAPANRLTVATAGALVDDDVLGALALIRGTGIKCYANRKTIYNFIAKVKDSNGNPMYTDSAMTDPLTTGSLRGIAVRDDENVADNVIYFGSPSSIEANLFEAINILPDTDVTNRVTTYGGYALFDCALGDPKAFAKLTITAAG